MVVEGGGWRVETVGAGRPGAPVRLAAPQGYSITAHALSNSMTLPVAVCSQTLDLIPVSSGSTNSPHFPLSGPQPQRLINTEHSTFPRVPFSCQGLSYPSSRPAPAIGVMG